MIVLVDAFNLIYKFPDLEENMARGELEAAMSGLLDRFKKLKTAYEIPQKSSTLTQSNHNKAANISKVGPKKGRQRARELVLHIFFDGKRKRGDETKRLKLAGMDLYYSHDLSADHLIMEFIQRNPAPGDLLIVSTDKKVREFARIHRCQRQLSEEFAQRMENTISEAAHPEQDPETSGEKPNPGGSSVPPDEVAYWEEMFRKGSQ